MISNFKTRISISPGFCIFIAISLLLLDLRWVIGWLTASLVHELFHYITICIYKCPVSQIQIGCYGVIMNTHFPGKTAEILCALAGPMGSLAVIAAFRLFPYAALCATMQLSFNLLPVYPMDGGRIIQLLLLCFFSTETSEKVMSIASIIIIAVVTFAGILLSIVLHMGMLPALVAAMLSLRIKKLAKGHGWGYNRLIRK